MLDAISVVVQISSAIIISRYDPSHSSGPMLCPTWPDNGHWIAAWESCQQLENYAGVPISLFFAFDDPSPAAFECALAMFTLATLYLYSSCQEYRYHKYSLVAAVGAAAIASITRHFVLFDEPLAHSIQISLPTSIMVASIVNTIIHQSGYLGTSRGQESEPQWKQKEKTLTEGYEEGEKQGS